MRPSLFLSMLGVLAVVMLGCLHDHPRKEFDSSVWKQGPSLQRERMALEIVRQRALSGLTPDQAKDLLGEPDIETGNQLSYFLSLPEMDVRNGLLSALVLETVEDPPDVSVDEGTLMRWRRTQEGELGKAERLRPNSSWSTGSQIDGKYDRVWTNYWFDGRPVSVYDYDQGMRVRGRIVGDLYEWWQEELERDGPWIGMYSNTVVRSCQGTYDHGKKAGLWSFWYPDGRMRQQTRYAQDGSVIDVKYTPPWWPDDPTDGEITHNNLKKED
jgi:hypothetical protein